MRVHPVRSKKDCFMSSFTHAYMYHCVPLKSELYAQEPDDSGIYSSRSVNDTKQ